MRKLLSVLKLLVLTGIVIGIPLYVYFLYPELIEQFSTMEGVNDFLAQYKTASIFVYIGIQIIQIIISVIPGQFIQFAGGYAYSFWPGYIFSIIGIAIGTSIAFLLARILGRNSLHVIFGEQKITRFVNQLNSKKAFAIIFVLFLIPGLPKDLITYAAGVSEFRYAPFMIISLVGRTPALMGTIMMGSMLHKESYFGLIMLAIAAVILCLLMFIKRNYLTYIIDKFYYKFIQQK